jgi:hypothetical protein
VDRLGISAPKTCTFPVIGASWDLRDVGVTFNREVLTGRAEVLSIKVSERSAAGDIGNQPMTGRSFRWCAHSVPQSAASRLTIRENDGRYTVLYRKLVYAFGMAGFYDDRQRRSGFRFREVPRLEGRMGRRGIRRTPRATPVGGTGFTAGGQPSFDQTKPWGSDSKPRSLRNTKKSWKTALRIRPTAARAISLTVCWRWKSTIRKSATHFWNEEGPYWDFPVFSIIRTR